MFKLGYMCGDVVSGGGGLTVGVSFREHEASLE